MKNDYSDLKHKIAFLNINDNTKNLAYYFLEIFENEKCFEISLEKSDEKVIKLYIKGNVFQDLFGKKIKNPFDLYLADDYITFYFRHKQEVFIKGIEVLKIYLETPNEKGKGDYLVKIYDKNTFSKFIEFLFNKKLGLNIITNQILNNSINLFANEIDSEIEYSEGKTKKVTVNSYERNNHARNECIKHFGMICQVCQFNFQEKFGILGVDFIHVHHKIDIASIGNEYLVNPLTDLIPVCPNCHSMLHKKTPSYSIEELKEIMLQQRELLKNNKTV